MSDEHLFVGRVLAVVHDLVKSVDEFTVARVRYEFNRRGLKGSAGSLKWDLAMTRAVSSGLIVDTGREVESTYQGAGMVKVYRRSKR